jgi:hypothetical protein
MCLIMTAGADNMQMKKRKFKPIFAGIALFAALAIFSGTSAPMSAQTVSSTKSAVPYSITNNFGADPEAGRNFTWVTSASVKTGFVEYCRRADFIGFGKPNIVRLEAKSHAVKTDLDSRTIHKAAVNHLLPGTEYVYRVGSSSGYSAQGVFKTAEIDPDSFTFLNITDTQGGSAKDYNVWKNTLDKALSKFPDAKFLVHTGDMVDAGYLAKQWDMFISAAQGEMMNLPILPAVGNHDALNKNKTNYNFSNFTDRFNLPDSGITGTQAGTVYSVDYGDLHIAVMNTQCGSSNYKKQAEWLEKDMSSSNKLWKVVALHRGPYGATYDTTDIRKAWAPTFDKLGIDLVLQGHDHNYMRSYPMKNGKAVQNGKGTIYMIGNTGGVKYYPLTKRSWQAVDLQPKTPMYIAVAVSRTKMTISAYDTRDVLRDTVTIKK